MFLILKMSKSQIENIFSQIKIAADKREKALLDQLLKKKDQTLGTLKQLEDDLQCKVNGIEAQQQLTLNLMSSSDPLQILKARHSLLKCLESLDNSKTTCDSFTVEPEVQLLSQIVQSISQVGNLSFCNTTVPELYLQINTPVKGCSSLAKHSFKLADDLWLCATGPHTKKTWDEVWQVCNEKDGFHLASVGPMSKRGKPPAETWEAARKYFLDLGYDYVVTGQPTRKCSWEDWKTGFAVKSGLGYINLSEGINSATWNELVDGNTDEKRTWTSASTVSDRQLVTLCMKATNIQGAYLFNHIWRL